MSLKVRTAEATLRVASPETAEADLHAAAGEPAILTISRRNELMELAAARLMNSRLAENETSVGVALNVTYASRCVAKGTVRAVATSAGISGRLHRFNINVFDETGLIGSAEHTRAVIVERKLSAVALRLSGMTSVSSGP